MLALVQCPASLHGEETNQVRQLLQDTKFAEGFGASLIYGKRFTLHPTRHEGRVLEYREIAPYQVHLIPEGPIAEVGVREHPWDFQEGLHHNFTDSFGHKVGELHPHRLVVNHTIEVNTPESLRFCQYNNYRLAPDDPNRDTRLVKQVTSDRQGTLRVYYNSQNEIRNAANAHTARWARDTWPHMLVLQTFRDLPRLADFERIDLKLAFEMLSQKQLSKWPQPGKGVSPSSMNLNFMFFMREIENPQHGLFAGMMLHTSLESHYKPHVALDQWGTVFYRDSIARVQEVPEIGKKYTVVRDVKQLVRDALAEANKLQPELAADPDDYYLFSFSVGLEGMGHWESEFEVSDVSLAAQAR